MQEEMTAILLDQENANLSERIYLKSQAKGINSKLDVVNSMLEEVNEKRSALKLAYAFLDSELKVEINNLIDKLCESNFDMKKSYNNYFSISCFIFRYRFRKWPS